MNIIFEFLKNLFFIAVIVVSSIFLSFYFLNKEIEQIDILPPDSVNYNKEIICAPSLSMISFNEKNNFCVDLVSSGERLQRGLMFIKKMPDDYGMLFDFKKEQQFNMWMKNTPLSLDMVFMDKNKCILSVVQNTKPFSEEIISSPPSSRYVLEVKSGTFIFEDNKNEKMCMKYNVPMLNG